MGTRSDIIVHCADGSWKRIYCHWDGYLSHNGRILFDHYTTQALAEALVAPGDMSSLAPKCDKPAGHSFDNKIEGYCVYYGRDRGETGVEPRVGKSLQAIWPPEDTWTEFTYVWADQNITDKPRDPCWWVGDPDEGTQTLINLGDALMGKDKVTPRVKAFGMVIGQHAPHDPKKPDDHKWRKGTKRKSA